MPRCYFLPSTGEIRSSSNRYLVGRKNLIPKRHDVGRGPPVALCVLEMKRLQRGGMWGSRVAVNRISLS
jgi:hypothetical protein